MLTKEILIKEVEEHLNEVVIDGLQLSRLVGCAEDEYDFYYKYDRGYGPDYAKHGHGIIFSSAVGKPMYIKDYLPIEEYDKLDRLRELNGAVKVPHFVFETLGVEEKE